MKKVLVPLLLLYLSSPTADAWAEPLKLPDEDLQAVSGGLLDLYFVMPITIVHSSNTTVAETGGQLVLRPPRWCAPSNAAPGSAGPESRYLGPRPPPQGQRSPAERVEAQPTWRNLRSGDRWRPAKVSPWPDVLQVILPVGPPARTEPVIRCPRNRRRIAPIAGPSWAVGPDGVRRGDANRLIALGRPTIPRVAAERERARNRLAVRQHRERRGPLRNTPFENP
jgi:hypothetical protein